MKIQDIIKENQQGVAEDLILNEGIIDFISKSKDKFLRLKDALSDEWAQSKEMWRIVQKGNIASQKEINFANTQFKDILRVVGLAAWYSLPIPGNTLLILATEKLLNKIGMSIIPDKIRNQVLTPTKQGVAEGTDLPPRVIEMIKKIAQSGATPEHKKAAIDALVAKYGKQGVQEGQAQPLTVAQLAMISDEALDRAYGYGRSQPGNTFGWQANLMSAAYAKKMIDAGITDIERISDAIHKGWNVTAAKFVKDPDQFADTAALRQAGKLDAKLQQRDKLMRIGYAQLADEEKEKDRVVARALLQALRGS